MKNKLIPLLTLAALLVMAAPSYAQSASTEDDGGGLPIPIIVVVGAVILALLTRNIAGLGSRRGDAAPDYDDEDELIVERPKQRHKKERGNKKRKGRGTPVDDDDPEIYLIERDDVWEEDGYGGEEDVGF